MSDAAGPGSLASRITKPESWADQVASPPPETTSTAATDQVDGATEPANGSRLHETEHDVEVTLADIQGDVDSPLYSVSSFEALGINPQILQGLLAMNFKKPSKIQERALPLLLSNPPTNMIAQSQSGTGKTAAFVITLLSRIDLNNRQQPQALVLAPSRELARQIEGVIRNIGKFVDGLVIQPAVPGAVERNARVQANVVVGTPGTVMDLIKRRQLDASAMRVLILDEADNMLDQQGLGDQCVRVRNMLQAVPQVLLFSATFPEDVMKYAERFTPKANQIKLRKDELTVAGIKQMYLDCSDGESTKYTHLVKLYGLLTVGSSIIFCKKRVTADKVQAALEKDGHRVSSIHGAFDGAERDRVLELFRTGQTKVLITTNVLARGIDVDSVSMVINYDIPMKGKNDDEPDVETYLHRIGRTGRFGRVGVSISFVFDKKSFDALNTIASHFGIDLVALSETDWDSNEEVVNRIIKTSRAGTNLKQG